MLTTARNIYQSRELLIAWTLRNIRARYQQSIFGWFWAVIQPVTQVLIFSIIFTKFIPIDTGDIPYIIFSYVAMVPWTLFASSIPDMANTLVGNMSLVTKIYFPREILPIASMLTRLTDFGISGSLLIILIIYYHIPIIPIGLLYIPIILIVELLIILGLGLFTAAANVFYRDIQTLLVLVIQIWFYACPIIYPSSMVPESLRPFYFLNPMAGVIEAYRDVLLYNRLPGTYLILSGVISTLFFFIGYWFFKRVEYKIADIV